MKSILLIGALAALTLLWCGERWLPGRPVALFVVVLSLAGYAVTMRAINDERGNAARRKAEVESLQVDGICREVYAPAPGLSEAAALDARQAEAIRELLLWTRDHQPPAGPPSRQANGQAA